MPRPSASELQMAEAIGQISEANKQIAESMKGIHENLKILNDKNILHATTTEANEKTIIEEIRLMRGKYWWALVILFMVVLFVLGYKELATKVILP